MSIKVGKHTIGDKNSSTLSLDVKPFGHLCVRIGVRIDRLPYPKYFVTTRWTLLVCNQPGKTPDKW